MMRKCLFPVAGYGTRFLPATKAMPKEMLPVLNKPLVQYGVEEAAEAGLKDVAFVTGRGKRSIEDHFDLSYELEDQLKGTDKEPMLASIRDLLGQCTFSYTRQKEMRGLGHAILTGERLIGQEPFGVILADDLCVGEDQSVLAQMVQIHDKYQCSIVAVQEVPMEDVSQYGVVSGRELEPGLLQVDAMVEKPDRDQAPSNLAIIGRYVLTPDIFSILQNTPPGRNGEVQLTDAINAQAQSRMVLAYKIKGKRFDCGSIGGFVEATNFFYQRLADAEQNG